MGHIESKTKKRLFKTESGVEIRPALLTKDASGGTSEETYYYAWYVYDKSTMKWAVKTNPLLYHDSEKIIICKDRDEAMRIAAGINNFINLLTENI